MLFSMHALCRAESWSSRPAVLVSFPDGGLHMPRPSILVPLDFSDATDAVLTAARRLSRAYGAEIHLLHVGREHRNTGGMEFELADHLHSVRGQHAAGRAQLDSCAQILGREGFRVRTAFAVGDACASILGEARALNPAAIVIGTHARGGVRGAFRGAFRGRVRRSLLSRGAWPVLVVPAGSSAWGDALQAVVAAFRDSTSPASPP